MKEAALATQQNPVAPAPGRKLMLQRKCACDGSAGLSGDCEECQSKRLTLKRYSINRAEPSTLLRSLAGPFNSTPPLNSGTSIGAGFVHNFSSVRTHTRVPQGIQTKRAINDRGEQYAKEADRVPEQVTNVSLLPASGGQGVPSLSGTESGVQPRPVNQTAADSETAPTLAPAAETPEPASPEATSSAGVIVEDDATELAPGQMRKTEFLDQLHNAVCTASDAELAAVGRTAQGCPFIERWIGYYRTRDSQHIERALRRYAPEAAGATTARDYIPLVSERVRRGVARWATTGEITEVPEELMSQVLGGGLLAAVGGLFSGVASVVSSVGGGTGRALRGVFAKAREGGAKEADAPAIQSRLGSGSSIDSGVRSHMESAFGHDFSSVRVHTDSKAAELSAGLNARAFTIGSDIAFGAGEYKPKTLVGDALLAHELAHVVQQGSGSSFAPAQHGSSGYKALEEDADLSAVSAVASMWGGAKGVLARTGKNAMPRLKSGLSIRRCSKGGGHPCSVTETQTITTAKSTAAGWVTTALGKLRTTPVPADVSASLQRNFGATDGVAANIPSITTKITTANTEMTTVPISCAGTEDSTCAKAPCGYTPSAGDHAYVICSNATLTPGSDPIYQAGCVLHEAFHSAFSDFTGDSYSGWGGHSNTTAGYPGTNPLKNADSYASLVIDLK